MDKIYVAEDNQSNRYFLKKVLTGAGYEVQAFKNGKELLDALNSCKPDLIVTDVRMPVMDGFELVDKIRELHRYNYIPIIITSATFQDINNKIKGFDLGANDYLTPPINEDELTAKVKSMIRIKKMYEELQESEEKYHAIFESTGTATLTTEEDTTIVKANKECERITGYAISGLIGKSWTKFVYKEDLQIMLSRHKARRKDAGSAPDKYEVRLIDAKGDIKNAILSVGMIPGSKRSIVSMIDITERKQAEDKLKKTLNASIQTMSRIIEAKDPYTAGHQQRVSRLTTAIAKELNLSQDKIEGVRIASLIHDIGKISVPTEILSKSSTLSDLEFSLIKEHSQTGHDILKPIDFSYPVAQIVLQHHERINGTGYPRGLKGEDILLEARILGVADVVEAMSSHRPYRPALGIDAALEDISKNKGILYDPEVVDACLKLFKEEGFKF